MMQARPARRSTVRNLVLSAVCLALCIVLPFLTGQVPQIGSMLCPMHIPVLLAGFLCGPLWAMGIGAVAPMLRFLLFSMPPPLPTGLAMTFELLAYGLISGLLYRALPKKPGFVYVSLLGAMAAGRAVWGVAAAVIYGTMGTPFTWPLFFAGAVSNALPGIILQIVLIPVLVLALRKANIINS